VFRPDLVTLGDDCDGSTTITTFAQITLEKRNLRLEPNEKWRFNAYNA